MSIKLSQPLISGGCGGVRAMLAYVIAKTLGSDWHESQKLVEFSKRAPSGVEKLRHELR